MDNGNFLGSYSITLGSSTIESSIGEQSCHSDNNPSQTLDRSGAVKICACCFVVAIIIIAFILGGVLISFF